MEEMKESGFLDGVHECEGEGGEAVQFGWRRKERTKVRNCALVCRTDRAKKLAVTSG